MKNKKTNFTIHILLSVICMSTFNRSYAQTSVKIGKQEWMLNNLNVATFNNGDTIPEVKSNEAWVKAGKEFKPAWCYYNNDPKNAAKYGKLYNFFAVIDPRGLAPGGWHIPSEAEWTELINSQFGNDNAGYRMKSKEGWLGNKNGNNESGFTGIPGGGRYTNGTFKHIGNYGNWWSSRQAYTLAAWRSDLYNHSARVVGDDYGLEHGYSVRCIKD